MVIGLKRTRATEWWIRNPRRQLRWERGRVEEGVPTGESGISVHTPRCVTRLVNRVTRSPTLSASNQFLDDCKGGLRFGPVFSC